MPLEAANGSHFGPNNCGDNDMGHMTLKRKISASEEELRDLLSYPCPITGKTRCPPYSVRSLASTLDVVCTLGFDVWI